MIEYPENNIIVSDENGYGPCLLIDGPWSEETSELTIIKGIRCLRISEHSGFGKGWTGFGVDFLKDFDKSYLVSIEIYSRKVRDVTPLKKFSELKKIGLETSDALGFQTSDFPRLEVLFYRYTKAGIIDTLPKSLKTLKLDNYPHKSLENLPAASGLLELLVGSRNLTSLSGISSFPTVKKVRILDAISLIDLSSLFLLSNLETLYLHNVKKLKKFECLRGNKSLRELKFINCKEIDSISFLGDLENLEHIEIGGNTVVRDGDLSVLLRLPKLRSAIITPKAHYEPRAKEVFNRLRSQGK